MATLLLRAAGSRAIAATARKNTYFLTQSIGPMSTQQAYYDMDAFWKKNRKLNRPLSPHLTIYKPELPMLTSLAHRVTGIAMALTVSGASIFFFLAPGDYAHYLSLVQSLEMGSVLILLAKYVLSIPMVWHYINGMRHLAWDWAWGFSLPTLYKTGYGAMVLTFLVCSALIFGLK